MASLTNWHQLRHLHYFPSKSKCTFRGMTCNPLGRRLLGFCELPFSIIYHVEWRIKCSSQDSMHPKRRWRLTLFKVTVAFGQLCQEFHNFKICLVLTEMFLFWSHPWNELYLRTLWTFVQTDVNPNHNAVTIVSRCASDASQTYQGHNVDCNFQFRECGCVFIKVYHQLNVILLLAHSLVLSGVFNDGLQAIN